MKIWVTSKNQEWASKMTGLPLQEIDKMYQEARAKKAICTIEYSAGSTLWVFKDAEGNKCELAWDQEIDMYTLAMTEGRWAGRAQITMTSRELRSLREACAAALTERESSRCV